MQLNPGAPCKAGVVYTFYSFKGGVGRSMALANIAALLSKAGRRVLVVDWDLEAPGLERYFPLPPQSVKEKPGLIDWVESVESGAPIAWKDCLLTASPFPSGVPISILHAGRDDGNYIKRVERLSWKRLFAEADFGEHLEQMRSEWIGEFEAVLVDSRTGLSDMGGICTIHLPDALIVFFTANDQSVLGVKKVVDAARSARGKLPYDRHPNFFCVPVPSRWESLNEHEISKRWQKRFVEEFGGYYREWLAPGIDLPQTIADLSIPYKAFWSFGEQLPVLEPVWDASDPAPFYKRLAENIESGVWSGAPVMNPATACALLPRELAQLAPLKKHATQDEVREVINRLRSEGGPEPERQALLADAYSRLAEIEYQIENPKGAEEAVRSELALRLSLAGAGPDAAKKLFDSYAKLFWLLIAQNRWDEVLGLARHVADSAAALNDELALQEAIIQEAQALYRLGRFEESLSVLERRGPTHGAQIDEDAVALQSSALMAIGHYEDALEAGKRLEEISLQSGNRRMLAASYENQAMALASIGRYGESVQAISAAEAIWEPLGDQANLARIYSNHALLLRNIGSYGEALVLLERQERLVLELGDRNALQLCYASQAAIRRDQGLWNDALNLFSKQAAICRELKLDRNLCTALFSMAEIARQLGLLPEAKRWASESLETLRRLSAGPDEIDRVQAFLRDLLRPAPASSFTVR